MQVRPDVGCRPEIGGTAMDGAAPPRRSRCEPTRVSSAAPNRPSYKCSEILDGPSHADRTAIGAGGDVEIVDQPGQDRQAHLGVVELLLVRLAGRGLRVTVRDRG